MHQQVRWQSAGVFAGFDLGNEKVIPTKLRDSGDTGRFPRPIVMTTYNECVAQIQQILRTTVAKGDVVGEDMDLIEELGLASLDVMELIEQLEDVFDISFPINELGDVRTISDLARRVQLLTDR